MSQEIVEGRMLVGTFVSLAFLCCAAVLHASMNGHENMFTTSGKAWLSGMQLIV
jgi:hypothetical protein